MYWMNERFVSSKLLAKEMDITAAVARMKDLNVV